ncbi:MAG: sporulation protein YhbH [Bacillota bacterium]|nr:MAG: sporulation protein YhbH [Bacillota bacterium]
MTRRPGLVVSRDDWSLHRKGYIDQERHREKVLEAIRENLADLVAEESIIMSDGDTVIKVPVRSLEEYRFRFDPGEAAHVGQGDGGSRVGDVLGRVRGAGRTEGGRAGDEPGVDYYEAEVTVDQLAELIFADLGLPNLERKTKPELTQEGYEFRDVRRHGIMSNIDRRRTLREAIKRARLAGRGLRPVIAKEDLRFRTWEEEPRREANAVVMAMMDTSGSMGTFEKYVARSFFFWMVRFLRTRYRHVRIVFLAHDTRAREVTEEQFFTKGESGGTRCSSVYELALDIIGRRFAPSDYNLYPFHFSDGDNFPSDNQRSLELMRQLVEASAAAGYAEVAAGRRHDGGTLLSVLRQIEDQRFITAVVRDKRDVYPVLRRFFRGAGHGPGA